jgi:DNA-binding transcriptional LysR family regulator
LGVRLLNRTTRRISLTEEGRHYLVTCQQVLAAVQEGEDALTAQASEPGGHLTVTAPVLFGQMHVAPAVTRFVQRYENVRVSLLLYDRVVDLLEEGIDVGVRIGALQDSNLVAQTVGSLRRVVVASPAYLKRHGVPKHPRDLAAHNCLRFTSMGRGPSDWTFYEAGKAMPIAITGNLEFNQAAPTVQACVAGLGLGRFLAYQPAQALRERKLRIVLADHEPPAAPIAVVYPHARLLPARTRLFIEWMKQELHNFHL